MSGVRVPRWGMGLALIMATLAPACLVSIDDSAADRRPSASPDGAADGRVAEPSADGSSAEAGNLLPPVAGLVGYWSFDEAGGDVVHDSTGRFDGRLLGAPARGPGIKGSCIKLDGAQSFVVEALGGTSFPRAGTLAFSFRARRALMASGPAGLFDVEDDARSHVAVFPTIAGFAQFRAVFAPSIGGSLFSLPTDEWHWLVVTWSTSRGEVFVDGVSESAHALSSFVPSEQRFVFGTKFLGSVDEIALYDRVMDVGPLPRTR